MELSTLPIYRSTVIVCAAALVAFVFATDLAPRTSPLPSVEEVRTRTHSSRPDLIEISIDLPRPKVLLGRATDSPGDYVNIAGSTDHIDIAGAELPVIRKLIAIPNCDRVELFVEVSKLETIDAVTVRAPSANPVARESDHARRKGATQEWARVVDIQYARGQALARVEIYPVRYDAARKRITSPREIRLRLKPANPRGPIAVNTGPLQSALSAVVPNLANSSPATSDRGQQIIQSAGSVCWCPTDDDDWEAAADYISANCGPDYLIIVADELLNSATDSSLVEQLALKRAEFNGFNVAIARMGQIDSTPHNTGSPPLMRNFVEAIYDDASAGHMGDGRLGFLLLIGDAVNPNGDVILPTYYWNPSLYRDANSNGADSYFVLLDGTFDVIPDVLMGRLTVDAAVSSWELQNVVTKIVSYEPIAASSSWTNDILLMSGGSDLEYTFEGEGLSGFQDYFNAIEELDHTGSATFTQMHRLAAGSDILFSKAVCDEIAEGYSIVGLFDHANEVNFQNAFFPLHYDTLQNETTPSLVLCYGSHSGFFDNLGECPDECCYPSPAFPGLPCKVPSTPLDSLDVIAERLLVQPAGAIGVVAYGRTHQAPTVQRTFANAFRSLFQHRQGQLGALIFTTKLLSADEVTTRSLNLLGDPALSIHYQFDSVSADSIDLAVAGLEMAFTTARKDFARATSTQTMKVVVANMWRDAASAISVEIWRGEPGAGGSALLNSFVVANLPGHSDTTWTGSIGSFAAGDYDIYVVVDPDDMLEDPVPINNLSYRTLHVRDYAPDFPVAALGNRVELFDAVLGSPSELEISVGTRLYSSAGTDIGYVGAGPTGNLFRGDKRHFIGKDILVGSNQLIFMSEAGGSWQSYWLADGAVSDVIVLDHGTPDSMLVALRGTNGTGTHHTIRLYTVAGTPRWTREIGSVGASTYFVGGSAMAAGDVTGDGVIDVVYAYSPLLSASDSLGVIDGRTGSRVWAIAAGKVGTNRLSVRLVDIENDGDLEILVNTVISGEARIQCYGASGTMLWQIAIGTSGPALFFAPVDVNHDGTKEIVFAHGQGLGLISISGLTASVDADVVLTGERLLLSTPLAADIDGDDQLEFLVLCSSREPLLNDYTLEVHVFDDDLTNIGAPVEFPLPNVEPTYREAALGDLDGDGVAEFVFTTPDTSLHAIRVGSSIGRIDWGSVDGDVMRTSLYEQTISGVYSEHVAVVGRARVVSDATFGEGLTITAPADLQVGELDSLLVENNLKILGSENDSVRVRIDELASPGAYWGGFVLGNATGRSEVRNAVITASLSSLDHSSPLRIAGSRIANTSSTAVVSADSLWLLNSHVIDAGGNGLELGLGVVAIVDGSTIEDLGGSGVVCDSCSAQSRIVNSTVRAAGVHGAYLQRVHGFQIDSSVFEGNVSAGLRFESADGPISQSRMEDNAGGIVCIEYSSPVVEGSRINQNQSGISAAEGSFPILGYGSIGGNNCITNSSGYLVSNLSDLYTPILAHHDYWGAICCKPSKLFGNVSCDSCQTASTCDGAAAVVVAPLVERALASNLPDRLDLVSAAPNPFNPTVRIRFAVPAGGGRIQLVVYNVRGQRVAVLENRNVPAGYHDSVWNGADSSGRALASGVYFVQMTSTGFRKAMKVVLLK